MGDTRSATASSTLSWPPSTVYPYILPEDTTPSAIHGYITVRGVQHLVRIALNPQMVDAAPDLLHTQVGLLRGADVYMEEHMMMLLAPYYDVIRHRLQDSDSVAVFLDELTHLVETVMETSSERVQPGHVHSAGYYTRIVKELEAVGWQRVTSINHDLTVIEVTVRDQQQRPHTVTIAMSPQYPDTPPHLLTLLPQALPPLPTWDPGHSSLLDILTHFQSQLPQYSDFWDEMDILASNSWILEPEVPNRSHVLRRVSIGRHCSLEITVDPFKPRAVPRYRLLGYGKRIEPLQDKMTAYTTGGKWDPKISLKDNLEMALQLTLPHPETTTREELELECRICYSIRFEGQVPDVVCENERCSKPFHAVCLYNWLVALRDTRQAYDTLFGVCPYCQESITVQSKTK